MRAVLDASAVLAVYFDESGADKVLAALPGALLSAVNYTEAIGEVSRSGRYAAGGAAQARRYGRGDRRS